MTLKRVFFDAIRDDGVTDAGWLVDDDEMLTSCEELSSKFRDKNTPRFVYAARAAKVEGEAVAVHVTATSRVSLARRGNRTEGTNRYYLQTHTARALGRFG